MIKPYRIKHKVSGYFYQRYNGSNLGKKGKVYMRIINHHLQCAVMRTLYVFRFVTTL